MTEIRKGCLCGSVTYEISGDLGEVVACHCRQCAKTSGHFAVSSSCSPEQIRIEDRGSLTWYRSSKEADRGFCNRCGSSLFWRSEAEPNIYLAVGTLEPPTGLRLQRHIFVASKSDYYDLHDDLPKSDQW